MSLELEGIFGIEKIRDFLALGFSRWTTKWVEPVFGLPRSYKRGIIDRPNKEDENIRSKDTQVLNGPYLIWNMRTMFKGRSDFRDKIFQP